MAASSPGPAGSTSSRTQGEPVPAAPETPALTALQISLSTGAGPPAISLTGQLTVYTAPELRTSLLRLQRRPVPTLLVDLSAVTFMDTGGLATLIEAQQRATRTGGRLVLVGLQPRVQDALAMARVAEMFTIVGSPDDLPTDPP
jgi:anti-sigma B factor antagonist